MTSEMGKCDGCPNAATIEDWETGFFCRWCKACMAVVAEVRARPAREAGTRGAFLALGMVGVAVAYGLAARKISGNHPTWCELRHRRGGPPHRRFCSCGLWVSDGLDAAAWVLP